MPSLLALLEASLKRNSPGADRQESGNQSPGPRIRGKQSHETLRLIGIETIPGREGQLAEKDLPVLGEKVNPTKTKGPRNLLPESDHLLILIWSLKGPFVEVEIRLQQAHVALHGDGSSFRVNEEGFGIRVPV